MADIKKLLSEQRDEVVAKIGEYNAALKEKKDLATMSQIENELKEAETSYAETKCTEVFTEFLKSETPIKDAITAHSYLVLSHKVKRGDGGTIQGIELVEDKVRQIDLVKLCKFCHLDTMWQYKVEKFNQLLTLRVSNELKMSKAQIKKICDSFYMNELSRKEEMGETPDSNTAICKQLQMVLDAIIFEDNGNGKNVYRVNNRDVAYLLFCHTKRGKKTLSVAVAKNAYMHRLVADIAHRIVTGKVYDVEYRIVSADKVANAKAKEVSNAEPAEAETVVVEKSA